jgi:uncharacterized protein (DUF305 family)
MHRAGPGRKSRSMMVELMEYLHAVRSHAVGELGKERDNRILEYREARSRGLVDPGRLQETQGNSTASASFVVRDQILAHKSGAVSCAHNPVTNCYRTNVKGLQKMVIRGQGDSAHFKH